MSHRRVPKARHYLSFASLLALILLLAACGGKSPTSSNSTSPTSVPQPTAAPSPPTKSASSVNIPKACALLTTADVEKVTGYGNGLADARDLGEGTTNCSITVAQNKFKVDLVAGPGLLPVLPNEKQVALEGDAKGVVKDSGIGQGWMSRVEFPNYSVTLTIVGTATTLDPDKKIATVTKADGSTITYAQAYEALARAIAHNAATGAQMPSGVSDVTKKDDPCALLTLDDAQAVLTGFTLGGPESSPSAYGGNSCRYRGHSDSLKTNIILAVVYLTQQQFEQTKNMTTGKSSEIGGATVYQMAANGGLLLSKSNRYVNLTTTLLPEGAGTLEQIDAALQKWLPQLAQKIAARLK